MCNTYSFSIPTMVTPLLVWKSKKVLCVLRRYTSLRTIKFFFRNNALMANSCSQQQYNALTCSCKLPNICCPFLKLYIQRFSTNFRENYSIPNFTEIRSLISALIHADGRKDMKLTGSFGDYANAPKKNNLIVQNVLKSLEK